MLEERDCRRGERSISVRPGLGLQPRSVPRISRVVTCTGTMTNRQHEQAGQEYSQTFQEGKG